MSHPENPPGVFSPFRHTLSCQWQVPEGGVLHKVEVFEAVFDGSKILIVNGEGVFGFESYKDIKNKVFKIGNLNAAISGVSVKFLWFKHHLEISGKPFETYKTEFYKNHIIWKIELEKNKFRVVLNKDSLDIWVNGTKIEAERTFIDNGSVTHFLLGDNYKCKIETGKEGPRRGIITNKFYTENGLVEPSTDEEESTS